MSKKKKILSIDGGGLRGIIPCMVLAEIEARMGAPICSLFDLIAGTSTGGIIGLGLTIPHGEMPTRPKFTAGEMCHFYMDNGAAIFKKKNRIVNLMGMAGESYGHEDFVHLLAKKFGSAELRHALTDLLITSYDIEQRRPFYFLSRRAKEDPTTENFLVRDVARSTSAAPTYFEPSQLAWGNHDKKLALVDGGVFANNPAVLAYVEAGMIRQKQEWVARQAVPAQPVHVPSPDEPSKGMDVNGYSGMVVETDVVMLSLGTGIVTRPYHFSDAKDWGALGWLRPLIDIMMQGVSETVDYQMQSLLPPDMQGEKSYFRINPGIPDDLSAMDEVKNLGPLKAIAIQSVKENSDKIDEICRALAYA